LTVKNVYVSNRPDVHRIPTPSGIVQVVSLPWLRRSALLTREDTKNLTFEQINDKMQEAMTEMVAKKAEELDPELPAVLAAHVWVTGAKVGSESSMTIGQEHALLVSNVANPAFDYVALGHIHKHQVLEENPPVVYAGSLERLDFGEADDEKGFYIVEITPDADSGGRKVSYEFHPLEGRRFVTVNVKIEPDDIEPTSTVLKALSEKSDAIKDAIVRLQISLPAELEGQIRDGDIREALREAYYFAIAREVRRETRVRLRVAAEEITPAEALKEYLESKKVPAERAKVLQEYGERLIEEQGGLV
jgi:exonuclease SbcD